MLTLAFEGNLHLAPISSNPQNVLDFATGMSFTELQLTLLWPWTRYGNLGYLIWWVLKATQLISPQVVLSNFMSIAQQYPSAQVLGTDLSAIQPLQWALPFSCRSNSVLMAKPPSKLPFRDWWCRRWVDFQWEIWLYPRTGCPFLFQRSSFRLPTSFQVSRTRWLSRAPRCNLPFPIHWGASHGITILQMDGPGCYRCGKVWTALEQRTTLQTLARRNWLWRRGWETILSADEYLAKGKILQATFLVLPGGSA